MPTAASSPVAKPADSAAIVEVRRILIVGVSGYLGSALAYGLRDRFEIYGTYNAHPMRIEGVTSFALDVLNGSEIFEAIKKVEPDVVLYCAGSSNLDFNQGDKGTAEGLHIKSPALFFKSSPSLFHFVYFSSDQILNQLLQGDGNPPPAVEETLVANPANHYGTCKSQAEGMVTTHGRYSHVLRLGTLYGETMGSPLNARASWIDGMIRSFEKKSQVSLFTDEFRSFVYVGDVVRAVRLFLSKLKPESTIYNLAGPVGLNRADFGELFCKTFEFDELLIKRVKLESDRKSVAPRPKSCLLSSRKFENAFEFKFQPPRDGLHELAERMRAGFTKTWL